MDLGDRILNDLRIISSKVCSTYVHSVLQHIKLISKWVNIFYKQAIKTTNLGVYQYVEMINKQESGTFQLDGYKYKLLDPKDVKVIEKNDMCYIKLSDRDFDILEKEHKFGGACCYNGSFTDLEDENMTQEEIDLHSNDYRYKDYSTKDDKIRKTSYMQGIIILDTRLFNNNKESNVVNLYNISGDESFAYYHELGHLMTGQHEMLLKVKADTPEEMQKYLIDGTFEYAYNKYENQADAYACLKTGLSPEKVVEARFYNVREDIINKIKDLKFTGPKEERRLRILESKETGDIEKIKQDMLTNIKREINNMRGIAKLSLTEYIRSKYMKK